MFGQDRVLVLSVVLVGSALAVGCGDQRSSLKDHSAPLQAVARAEDQLSRLAKQMDLPDYDPFEEALLAGSHLVITEQLPYAIGKKLMDEQLRAKASPIVDQLNRSFMDLVWTPANDDPPNLDAARAGVATCLELVGELKTSLGGG